MRALPAGAVFDYQAIMADGLARLEDWLETHPRPKAVLAYVVVAAVTTFALAWDSAIFTCDLGKLFFPLPYGDGASFAAMHFKGLQDGGYYVNPFLGAPVGMDLHDFPTPDVFYLGTIALLVRLTGNWEVTWNVFYILGFPAAAVTALAVMRRYGVRSVAAMPSAVLFAFLPYHAARAVGHAHLGLTYFLAAVAVVLPLDVLLDARCGLDPPAGDARGWRRLVPRVRFERRDVHLYLVALAIGLWGSIYYWFFAIVVLVLAGVGAAASRRAWLPFVRAGALAAASTVTFLVQTAPVILFLRTHGRSPLGVRNPGDAETYALKIAQLVIPMEWHRIDAFRRFRKIYDARAPLVNENGGAYIGLVGAVGLAVLLVVVLGGRGRADDERDTPTTSRLLGPLAVVTLGMILLGTVGGLGSLVAFLGFPDVRSYNRISIFVGFTALFAVAVLLDRAFARARSSATRAACLLVAAAVTAFGVYDTTYEGTPDYRANARARDVEEAFVRDVEAKLPEGALLLQLPYMRFPESGTVVRLGDYAPMVEYLYSKRLRYSYGALRDRRGDAVYARLAARPPSEMLDHATASGFDAVVVYRAGFADDGKELEDVLRATLGPPIATRPDERVAVYSLAPWGESRRAALGPERVTALRRATLTFPFLGFRDGFYGEESRGDTHWRWADAKARLVLENPTPSPMRVELSMETWTAESKPVGRTCSFDGVVHFEVPARSEPQTITQVFELPPGEHAAVMRCNSARSDHQNDWRDPVFVVQGYALREVP